MELNFAELIALLLVGVTVVQSAMLSRSIPREAWDTFWKNAGHAAAKTEGTADDKVVNIGRNVITPILDKFGVFKSATSASEPLTGTGTEDSMDNDLGIAG